MNDLRFMIVNSNLDHSQVLLYELQSRVSFDVYQDTKDKNIWKLMEGGKDDIYVYDRCGRLAYYIPFPLSIMSADDGLVPSAILATYYRSPCGSTCDKITNTTLEDFLNNRDVETNLIETTEEEISSTTEFYKEMSLFNQSENVIPLFPNETLLDENTNLPENGTESYNYVDFDYPSYNDTTDENRNETDSVENKNFYNSLLNLFFSETTEIEDANVTESTNVPFAQNSFNDTSNDVPLVVMDTNKQNGTHVNLGYDTNDTHSQHLDHDKAKLIPPKPKSDRCVEADLSVCKNWSKRRLLRAHNCCTSQYKDESQGVCKHFRRKKCKKIQAVLKCCFKTAFLEKTTENETTISDPATTLTETTTEPTVDVTGMADTVTDMKSRIVCCLDMKGGRVCRVSPNHTCEGNEYISEDPIVKKSGEM